MDTLKIAQDKYDVICKDLAKAEKALSIMKQSIENNDKKALSKITLQEAEHLEEIIPYLKDEKERLANIIQEHHRGYMER